MTATDTIFESATEEDIDVGTIGSVFDSGEGTPKESYTYEETTQRPDRRAARTSGVNILSAGWMAAGSLLVSKQIDPPVGRVLQLEAPLAAQKVDEVIAYTWLDKLLQPIFSKGEQLEGLGAIIALPVMVGLYERKPAMAPLLEPAMKQTLGQVLTQVAPVLRKQKTKMRAAARSMEDIHEAFDIPRGADPIDAIFNGWIFQDNVTADVPDA